MTLLEQLKRFTVVVADTGDIHSIQKFLPCDATTNRALPRAAAQMAEYGDIVVGALGGARKQLGAASDGRKVVALAIDRLSVDFGLRILSIIPGRVSTEV